MKKLLLILFCFPFLLYSQSKKKIIADQNIKIDNLNKQRLDFIDRINNYNSTIFKLQQDNANLLIENQKINKLLYPDVSNLEDFGRSLFTYFKFKNFDQIMNFYPNFEEYLYYINNASGISEDKKAYYSSKEYFEEYFNLKKIENSVNKYYIKGEGIGIDWTTAKFNKIDDINFREGTNETIRYLKINFDAYNNKTESYREYNLRVEQIFLISNKWYCFYFRIFDGLYDITERKEVKRIREEKRSEEKRIREENELKKPIGLKIKGFKWSIPIDKKSIICKVKASFSNQTERVIKKIKYRISIFSGYPEKYRFDEKDIPSRYKKFSKTYETGYSFDLQPGDIIPFNIIDLKYDYFLGTDVVKQGVDWEIVGEIIEVR